MVPPGSSGTAVAPAAPRMRALTRAALLLLVAATAWVRPAHGTTADDLCDPAAPACVIDTARLVTNTSILDFGTRPLTIARRGSLDVSEGRMTIKAGTLTLASGSALFARGTDAKGVAGAITIQTVGGIVVNEQARIDLSTVTGGGLLDVTAGGNVDLRGVIAVQ